MLLTTTSITTQVTFYRVAQWACNSGFIERAANPAGDEGGLGGFGDSNEGVEDSRADAEFVEESLGVGGVYFGEGIVPKHSIPVEVEHNLYLLVSLGRPHIHSHVEDFSRHALIGYFVIFPEVALVDSLGVKEGEGDVGDLGVLFGADAEFG